jgi:anti-sigma B factor antagonist
MSHQGSFSSEPAGDQTEVLVLDGDFDRSNAAQFRRALDDALCAGRLRLIVDLRRVSFLDSTMRGLLVRGFGDAVARGRQLALIRPNPVVWRVFVLTGLSKRFPAFGRPEEALASFRRRS